MGEENYEKRDLKNIFFKLSSWFHSRSKIQKAKKNNTLSLLKNMINSSM